MSDSYRALIVGESIVVRKSRDPRFRKSFPLSWKPIVDGYLAGRSPSQVLQEGFQRGSPVRLRDWLQFEREMERGSARRKLGLGTGELKAGWREFRLIKIKLWGERNWHRRNYAGFYFLSFAAFLGAGLLAWWGQGPRDLLWIREGYDFAFAAVVVAWTMIGFTKGLVLIALHVLATGSVPEAHVSFRGLMLDLEVDASPVEAHRLRVVKLFYFATALALPLTAASIWSALDPIAVGHGLWTTLGIFQFLLSSNPRRRSECAKFLSILDPEWRTRRALRALRGTAIVAPNDLALPSTNVRNDSPRTRLTKILVGGAELLWGLGSVALAFAVILGSFAHPLQVFATSPGSARVSAGIALLLLALIASVTMFEGLAVWGEALRLHQKSRWRGFWAWTRSRAPRDPAQIRAVLSASPLFQNLDPAVLEELSVRGRVDDFHPGQAVIVQGDDGHELFLILAGEAVVRRHLESGESRDLAVLSRGAVFGEMSLLRQTERTASVIATRALQVFVLSRGEFERAFAGESIRQLERRIAMTGVLGESSIFRELPKETMQIFMSYGKFQSFRAGEVLIEQGDRDQELFIVLRGRVEVVRAGDMRLSVIGPAGFFGEMSLFENRPRSASVRALEDGLVLRVSNEGFWRMVDQNPALASQIQELSWLRRQTPENLAESGF